MKRNWILSGAVAAMLASASSAALAQDATPAPAPPAAPTPMTTPAPDNTPAPMAPAPDAAPAPMAPAPDATATPPPAMAPAPMDPSMPMANPGSLSSGSMSTPMMTPGSIDYSVLGNPELNYTNLKKAKALGFSDNQVASMEKIHRYSGVPFNDIVDRVLHGTAFSTLATQYNLNLGDVLDVADEKDKIAAYETAYEATGTMALKNSGSMGMMSPSSSMSTSSTMTPPMSTGSGMSMPMAPTKDIVALAMSDKRFSTLVKELKRADLVSALQGPGPFTVFAPTNAAFRKLPKNALRDLEKDPTRLAAVLKYHVLPARVDAATATSMTSPTSPPTLEGSTLQVTAANGTVRINDATVTQADIMATNGIIHAIDTVLMPSDLASGASGGAMSTPTTGSTDTTGTSGSANGTMTAPSSGTTGTTGTTPAAPTDQTVPPASGSTPSDSTPNPGVSPSTGTTPPATTPGTGTTTPATPAQ